MGKLPTFREFSKRRNGAILRGQTCLTLLTQIVFCSARLTIGTRCRGYLTSASVRQTGAKLTCPTFLP
jgi:hypothetical protein